MPRGTVTFLINQGGATIDLAFASEELANSMLECRIAPELDHRSDHLPRILRFSIEAPVTTTRPRRYSKNMDLIGLGHAWQISAILGRSTLL